MSYTIAYHPSVASEDLPKLDKKALARIKRAIEERLMVAPQEYGAPLRRTLKGYWADGDVVSMLPNFGG